MRRLPQWISLVILLQVIPARAAADLTAKFDEYMQAQAKTNRFMGAVLVAKDGRVVFNKGFGWANAEWQIPNTPRTKFRLGSVTKQFTAGAILVLEEQGKLSVQ